MNPDLPARHGLYDPRFEHDACGVSFVANVKGHRSRSIVDLGLTALMNMEHRGATGAEPDTGDGAGILVQMPDAFMRATAGVDLPAEGHYAAGMAFLPADPARCAEAMATVERITREENLRPLGWREVPVNPACLGASARAVMPAFRTYFVDDPAGAAGIELDRRLFIVRKRIEHELTGDMRTYFSSLSARTFVYKGMLTTPELGQFFPDLSDGRMESALALVHSRFSTNTFPSWPLAHPYRYIAHNGEINTVQGNRNWMRTREALLQSDLIPGLERAYPVCTPGMSDSASFDEVLELLHLAGRSLPHALLMMIPEAWENNDRMDPRKRAFYRFHAALMEPWDGPADVCFTDGTVIGAVLDRNGLRPGRFWVTNDDLVVLASEAGVLDIEPSRIIRKGRLQPGRMFLID
ncbi:MAG: glutamate synthase large subunit, partial [Actinomycetota bacterium]